VIKIGRSCFSLWQVNMMTRSLRLFCCTFFLLAVSSLLTAEQPSPEKNADESAANENDNDLWIDPYRGEAVRYESVLEDLAGVQAVYLGERHRLKRHHRWQARIISDLAAQGVSLVLGIEQMEAKYQPQLDRFNRGEIDFDELAQQTDWADRWRGYAAYRPVLEAARIAKAPVVALNAQAETIRQVYRGGGVDKLSPELRRELPAEMDLKDPEYLRLLGIYLNVHKAANDETLRPMIEAQIARDEHMAATLVKFLKSPAGKGRTAVVVCGSGHVNFGLGTASRVRRRLPQIKDRMVIFSESGELTLTPEERAASRAIRVSHEDLRQMHRPIGDYLQVTPATKNQKQQR
jgi:uncharacterized iron-regulated protein